MKQFNNKYEDIAMMINIEQNTLIVFNLAQSTTIVRISKPNPTPVPTRTKTRKTLLIVPSVLKAISNK